MSNIQWQINAGIGLITLDRPKALNALSLDMVRDLHSLLTDWQGHPEIEAVAIRGSNKIGPFGAFCAGGDIRFFHEAAITNDPALEDFFTEEYSLNHLIFTYPKPYIAFMDGIVMGGGMGISLRPQASEPKTRRELGLPEHMRIAINQGSGMNVDRGLEEAVSAVAGMEGWLLLLVGSGDAIPSLKEKVAQEGWQGKVKFIDRLPYEQLLHYTAAADVGLSLDKDSNINYRFSLPNKLFDYIQCNTPVVTSRVVEVKRIVEDYNVGLTVHVENILALRRSIAAVAEHREAYEPGLKHAQEALSWEKECIPLRNFYAQFL